jgi:hypothetical protein
LIFEQALRLAQSTYFNRSRMALAYGLIAAGVLLLIAGFIGIGLHRNDLHSAACI